MHRSNDPNIKEAYTRLSAFLLKKGTEEELYQKNPHTGHISDPYGDLHMIFEILSCRLSLAEQGLRLLDIKNRKMLNQ